MPQQIIQGDCIQVLSRFLPESFDACVTSPPYAMQRKEQYGGVLESEFPEWAVAWMAEVHRVLKPEGSVLLNIREHVRDGQISDYVHRTRMALREWGWFEWDELIWVKTTSAPIGHPRRPRRRWERLLWFGKSRQGWCDSKAKGNDSDRVGRIDDNPKARSNGTQNRPTGSLRKDKARVSDVCLATTDRGWHPAAFSVDLARWCVALTCPVGGLVLDPFAGSGTTGEACALEGMDFLGVELDIGYARKANERLAAL